MYSTLVYLYQQKHEVLIPETGDTVFNLRWRPVYSKTLKLNKGVDNVILFQCYNQDQKPVDVTASTLVFRMLDRTSTQVLLTKILEPVDLFKGRAKLVVLAHETTHIPSQMCHYSVVRESEDDFSTAQAGLKEPVFVDDHAGARGVIDVVDSVYPSFRGSQTLTVPDLWADSSEVFTSEVNKRTTGILTFQIRLDAFTGVIQPQATIGDSGIWYDAGPEVHYVDEVGDVMLHVDGHYDTVRLRITPTAGNITRILYR